MLTLLVRAALLGLLLALPAHAQRCENPPALRIANVPVKNAALLAEHYRPFYRHLEAQLGRPVRSVAMTSYGAVIEGLLAGEIDVAEMGPASYVIARNKGADIEPFATFSGQRGTLFPEALGYFSVLIVPGDSEITRLDQLAGRQVSLTDPASTSGALIPQYAVRQHTGRPIEALAGRITFAGSHDQAIEAVQKHRTDAAFVASPRLDEMVRLGRLDPKAIRIVWTSDEIPFDPFVMRRALCPELADRLKRAFFTASPDRQAFFEALKRPGLVPVTDAHYRIIHDIYRETRGPAAH